MSAVAKQVEPETNTKRKAIKGNMGSQGSSEEEEFRALQPNTLQDILEYKALLLEIFYPSPRNSQLIKPPAMTTQQS